MLQVKSNKDSRLEPDQSDRIATLKNRLLELMNGDNESALKWLHSPQDIFDGESPLERAKTEVGAKDVDDLIGRLENGVFS